MTKLTEILPDVFVVEVEADASDFYIEDNKLYYKDYFIDFGKIGMMRFLPEGEWQYLGTCTKDETSFDVIKEIGCNEEDLHSLLLSKGIKDFEKLVVIKKQ